MSVGLRNSHDALLAIKRRLASGSWLEPKVTPKWSQSDAFGVTR